MGETMIRNLIALLLLTSQAFAGLPPTTLKGQGGSKVTTFNFQVPPGQATQVSGVDSLIETGNRNILPNPGFEGTTGWTASGGATTAINTTAVGTGVNGYDWDSNSASQTLTGTAVTIPAGLKGQNGVVSCNIYTVSGSATHLLKAYDGTNDIASGSITSVAGSFVRTSINFVFPSSGTITVRLTSVASNEPEIYVDDCYLGPAFDFNISQVNQATLIGSAKWPATLNCEWSQTGTGTFTADTDCTNPTGSNLSGQASAPATKVPGIRFSGGLPPGEYLVMAIGSFYCNNSSNNCVSAISLSDGTNRTSIQKIIGSAGGTTSMSETVSVVSGRFNYTTAQGDTTIQLYSEQVAAGNLFVNANTSITSSDLQFLVYRFPSSSEVAYRPDMINWKVDANISGANPDLGTSAITSYTEITNSSLTLVNNTGTSNISAKIPCSSTNPPTGTTCAVGNESVGINFDLPVAGDVLACVSFGNSLSGGGGGSRIASTFQIVETPSNAQTILQEGKTRISNANPSNSAANNSMEVATRVCGNFSFSSIGNKTLRLMYEQSVTGTGLSSIILGDANTSNGQRDIHWEVYPLNQSIPAPVLVGSVTSNSLSAQRLEWISVTSTCTTGTCTTAASSSSAITNVTWLGTGSYSVNFPVGIWSAAPICTITSAGDTRGFQMNTTSTTAFTFVSFNPSTGSAANSNFNIICMGPR